MKFWIYWHNRLEIKSPKKLKSKHAYQNSQKNYANSTCDLKASKKCKVSEQLTYAYKHKTDNMIISTVTEGFICFEERV